MSSTVKRIGLFVCHCGNNIAGTVDIEHVVGEISGLPGVAYAVDYRYFCSDPGQSLIREAIEEHHLDGIIVAACSPTLHENTFRRAAALAGLNEYQCEIANIREHCSWVHKDKAEATRKAILLIKATIAKLELNESLHPIAVPVSPKALVIGGGPAGMQAALSISAMGHDVILAERTDKLGGNAARLGHTFPAQESAQDLVKSIVAAVTDDPRVKVMLSSQIEELSGYVGNFDAVIRVNSESICRERIGAVIVAVGSDLYETRNLAKYGKESYADVVDTFEFEKLISDQSGELRRPSDGSIPESVLFVQCVGFHDEEEKGPLGYCSKVCCMYVVKQSLLYKKKVPHGQVYVLCRNIHAGGKRFEELTQKAQEEEQVLYVRGPIRRMAEDDGKLHVLCHDMMLDKQIDIEADLVVLVPAMVPDADAAELAKTLKIATDQDGFMKEAHPKLRPLETQTPGIFLAGCCQGPKDIAETIAQALGAAGNVKMLFSQDQLFHEPTVAVTNKGKCALCGVCIGSCPHGARAFGKKGRAVELNEVLCEGCGICAAACPGMAIEHKNYADEQVSSMIKAILE